MTSYWFTDLCAIFNSFSINPFYGRDKNQQYNSLTRLIILSTIIAAFNYPKDYAVILSAGLFSILLSVCIYFITLNSSNSVDTRTITDLSTEFSNEEDRGGLTNRGKELLEDYNTNTKNSFLINHPTLDTDNIKHRFILDGNKTPKSITNENKVLKNPDNKVYGKQIMTGTIKQLNSVNKNLSPV
tara:strand:- start:5372 stop:5926 length:555 start_codon:yes stop_codon:yes gene_type:complete